MIIISVKMELDEETGSDLGVLHEKEIDQIKGGDAPPPPTPPSKSLPQVLLE